MNSPTRVKGDGSEMGPAGSSRAAGVACRPDVRARLVPLAAAALFVAGPATAVLIASGDGSGNISAPPDDPGFANVGILNGLSAVYLGNGWVLTAAHVGQGDLTLGGVTYPLVPGSYTRLTGPNPSPPDLAVMKIAGDPGLPAPVIVSSPAPNGSQVVLIGRGKSRGAATSWMGHDGWNWDFPFVMRWGTNRISTTGVVVADTQSLAMAFDTLGTGPSTADEANAVLGDSGGAVFWKDGSQWKLAGLMFVTSVYEGQPAQTSLYTNLTVAGELSYYRGQIQSIISTPACSDGLDDDLDGLVDHPADPGCDSPSDTSEQSPALVCDDGLDNDGDGLVDHPADPGCDSPSDTSEQSPALVCDDGLDNDGDTFIDHPADPECLTPTTPSEAPVVPAGAAWSLGVLVVGLCAVGARGARRRAAQSSSRTR